MINFFVKLFQLMDVKPFNLTYLNLDLLVYFHSRRLLGHFLSDWRQQREDPGGYRSRSRSSTCATSGKRRTQGKHILNAGLKYGKLYGSWILDELVNWLQLQNVSFLNEPEFYVTYLWFLPPDESVCKMK